MEALREKKGFICDMDGVIYHGDRLLPGVSEFVDWLYRENKKFLFLTNSSARSPRELQLKLHRMGLDVDESHFYTSALATADFLKKQNPQGCTAFAIGEHGLLNALHDVGVAFNHVDPDYVVVGDRLDTDIVAGIESGLDTVLVLSGVTSPAEIGNYPYRPRLVLNGAGEIPPAQAL